ncbi:hypothetical protein BEN47_05100 [Hymenobacter lapidarius]|uniref:Uncharacterized protein n=1 Tax=Hymenobacter lapidarius TaxID=1908237 RepID=A0A1G1STR2_9BACT|nr:hypothetical protein [Hymenobacter lapidarius]OGX81999.1 hypothetical protein BEN47_05100 [Hymenobacter lapidarius]
MDATFTLPNELLAALIAPHLERWKTEYLATLPAPDPWLTIPEAAAYAKLTDKYMAQLAYGKPFRAGTLDRPERAAVLPKIASGDTGFARGARVKQSAVDAYLMRHAYRKK